ncbi:MAG: lytic transglycosylase domain-containing protein [Blastocatellia bacterium]|nr:lytic transglycosylase domain-containing protein [Blastocatellia bacterium]
MKKLKLLVASLLVVAITVSVGHIYHHYYIHRFDQLIVKVSHKYGLDPLLIRSVVYEESHFDPEARSSAGAIGLMQITPIIVKEWSRVTGKQELILDFPDHFHHLSNKEKLKLSEEELLTNPEINLSLGCWYIDQLSQRYASLEEPLPIILASYNAGPANAQRWKGKVSRYTRSMTTDEYIQQIDFPETKNYVQRIIHRYKKGKKSMNEFNRNGWLFNID